LLLPNFISWRNGKDRCDLKPSRAQEPGGKQRGKTSLVDLFSLVEEYIEHEYGVALKQVMARNLNVAMRKA